MLMLCLHARFSPVSGYDCVMESQAICKVQVVQLVPKCPLDAMSPIICGSSHYPVHSQQKRKVTEGIPASILSSP